MPTSEEWQWKAKEFIVATGEQLAALSRLWIVALAAAAVLAIPVKLGLTAVLSRQMIASYQPPKITYVEINARDLQILQSAVLSTGLPGGYSAYAQIQNPNPNLAARQIDYHFEFTSDQGLPLGSAAGTSYLLGGGSRFLVAPFFSGAAGAQSSAKLVIDKVKWTRAAAAPVRFEILQKNTGINQEGQFFLEALVKNPDGWRIKKVGITALVFDDQNRKIIAVNQTQFTDLKSFESRYFRLLWASPLTSFGQIEILPEVNPFEPGAVLDLEGNIPVR